MDSSFWFDLNISRGVRLFFLKNIVFFCLNILFTFTISVDPDEMPHYAALHLGLYLFRDFSCAISVDTDGM